MLLHQQQQTPTKSSSSQKHFYFLFSKMVASSDQYLSSSLSCELKIIKAKNIELKSKNGGGVVFVRYYLSAGNNKRIQLSSQEIPSRSHDDLIWDESFSLECVSNEDSIKNLSQQSVVFELRWRDTTSLKSLLGKKGKSQLLGRAEVPWKTVLESPNMELEKWVVMVPSNNKVVNSARVVDEDHHVKPAPLLQVSMKVSVQAPKMVEKNMKKNKKSRVDECGCSGHDHGVGGCSCADYEIFALVAAFEAL